MAKLLAAKFLIEERGKKSNQFLFDLGGWKELWQMGGHVFHVNQYNSQLLSPLPAATCCNITNNCVFKMHALLLSLDLSHCMAGIYPDVIVQENSQNGKGATTVANVNVTKTTNGGTRKPTAQRETRHWPCLETCQKILPQRTSHRFFCQRIKVVKYFIPTRCWGGILKHFQIGKGSNASADFSVRYNRGFDSSKSRKRDFLLL